MARFGLLSGIYENKITFNAGNEKSQQTGC